MEFQSITQNNVDVRDFLGKPEINFSYKSRASWKAGSSEGVRSGRIRWNGSSGFDCQFTEVAFGEKRHSSKEVFIDIPQVVFLEMKKLDAEHLAHVAMESIFKQLLTELRESIKEIGGCDHGVGICVCHLHKLADDAAAALANLEAVRKGE